MSRQWYILHTYSGYENKVKTGVERLMKTRFVDTLLDVKVPVENIVELRGGKKRNVKKKFFPGYILVEMDIPDDEHSWKEVASSVKQINGVTGFLGEGRTKRPSPVSDDDMRNVLSKMGEIKTVEGQKASIRISYSVGENVKIIDGPFRNFSGVIEDINQEKGVLRVKVEVFGRATPVELDFLQVERV